MPKIFKISLLLVLGVMLSLSVTSCEGMKESTKKHSPQDTATYKSGDLEMAVSYSQPYKKGRLIFGSKDQDALVPYGEAWRTGANEATQLVVSAPVSIGGNELPAGTYTIYTIPGPDTWVFAVNKRVDYWGKTLIGSPFNEEDDVLRVEVPAQKMTEPLEQFTIDFQEDATTTYLRLMWDDTMVMVPINTMNG